MHALAAQGHLEAGTAETVICPSCTAAGKIMPDVPAMAYLLHQDCRGGTWCDCQHDTTGTCLRQVS